MFDCLFVCLCVFVYRDVGLWVSVIACVVVCVCNVWLTWECLFACEMIYLYVVCTCASVNLIGCAFVSYVLCVVTCLCVCFHVFIVECVRLCLSACIAVCLGMIVCMFDLFDCVFMMTHVLVIICARVLVCSRV